MNVLNESCDSAEKYMRLPSDTARQLYLYAEWVGAFRCKPDFRICRSGWDSCLLLYTVGGAGKLQMHDRTYDLLPGSVLLLDCRMPHEYRTAQAPWRFLFVHFSGRVASAYAAHLNLVCDGPVLATHTSETEALLRRVLENTQAHGSEALTDQLLHQLLDAQIMTYERAESNRIQCVTDYIAAHYMEQIDIRSIADHFHYSRAYFTTWFRAAVGQSPYAYLLSCRLAAARQQLRYTDVPIHTIAAQCGFSGDSAFIRAFKSKQHQTPLMYRKAQRAAVCTHDPGTEQE